MYRPMVGLLAILVPFRVMPLLSSGHIFRSDESASKHRDNQHSNDGGNHMFAVQEILPASFQSAAPFRFVFWNRCSPP